MCHPGPRPTRRPRPHPQAWDFDALGNWDSLTTDGGSPQTRTHNKQNEITAVSGATSPTFDANGNMTTDETGKQYVYDAWNRLKVVKNSGGTTLKTYVYDALNRRVAETAGGVTTDLYYSADWQVLEERDAARTNDTKARYVWSPVYDDAMVLRDRDTADDGTLDERLWVQQDANWNVTALTNSSGTVMERYVYDPYGVATVLNASWSSIGSSVYDWQHLHQGGRLDATSGLYHFRHRDYSPTIGKWMTMDPIGFKSGSENLNKFVLNNPVMYNDPAGLAPPLAAPIQPGAEMPSWGSIIRLAMGDDMAAAVAKVKPFVKEKIEELLRFNMRIPDNLNFAEWEKKKCKSATLISFQFKINQIDTEKRLLPGLRAIIRNSINTLIQDLQSEAAKERWKATDPKDLGGAICCNMECKTVDSGLITNPLSWSSTPVGKLTITIEYRIKYEICSGEIRGPHDPNSPAQPNRNPRSPYTRGHGDYNGGGISGTQGGVRSTTRPW